MKTKYLLIASSLFLLFSCSEKENASSLSGEIDLEGPIENAENRRETDPDASGGNKCLLDFQSKYNELISENDVLKATGFSKDLMETKYNDRLQNKEYHEFVFKFKNKRVAYIPAVKMETQVPDIIVVRSIKPMSLNQFELSYKAVSDEQMQAAKDAMDEVAEGNSGNPDADKAMQQAEEQNISKEDIKKTGSMLTDAFQEVSKGYRKIEKLGDAAVWNVVTNELIVLTNGVKFEIRTDLSNDWEKNKQVAVELAQIILDKCKS